MKQILCGNLMGKGEKLNYRIKGLTLIVGSKSSGKRFITTTNGDLEDQLANSFPKNYWY
jgi:hypothetical protein